MTGKAILKTNSFLLSIFLLIFFTISTANSTVYYVSNNGNDSAVGTSDAAAWATINKVNSKMSTFVAGDRILFRKSDTFFGQITMTKSGTAGNEIIFGSYGTGELPVLTGAKAPQNWILHSGNIFKTSFTDTVSNLYLDGKIMNIARYPNNGWLKIEYGTGAGEKGGFKDNELTEGGGYWNGVTCKIRTADWSYEVRTVSGFSSGNVTFSAPTVNRMIYDYGYYFDNRLSLLDTEREFYYDIPSQMLYFYAPGGVNPNTLSLQATVTRFNIYLNPGVKFVIIENLHLTNAKEKGVEEANGTSITVRNCKVSKTDKIGIRLYGTGHRIENNIIEDVLDIGITAQIFDGFITGNTIKRTGLKPGYGGSSWGYIGLRAEGATGTDIRYNNIDSSGYSGIRFGKDNILEYNIVDYSCVILNDGGGVAIDNIDGALIKNNIIKNSIGNKESCPATNYNLSYGIYFGNTPIKNLVISNNTIAHSRFVGIYIDNTVTLDNIQIVDNIIYNSAHTQIKFSDLSAAFYKPAYNTICKRNIFYSLGWNQMSMEHQMFNSMVFSDYGVFDSNYYCNPYNEYTLKRTIMPPNYSSNDYRFTQWKTVTGEDPNSMYSPFSFEQHYITDTLSSNYITNPHFNDTIAGWTTWPSGSSIARVIHPLLNGGAMRLRWNGIGYTENLAVSNSFPTTKGAYYNVSFSIVGDQTGDFNLWGRSSIPYVYEMGLRRKLRYENYRKNYSLIFKADTTDPSTTLTVGMKLPDSLTYYDNINFYKVNVQKIDSTEQSKLFINQTNSTLHFPVNGISYKELDGTPVVGSVLVPPYSSKILINDGFQPAKTLNLTLLIEGLYNTFNQQTSADTVSVYLRNVNSPYNRIDSAKKIFSLTGQVSMQFPNAQTGSFYFLEIMHRNSIETWSRAGGETFASNVLNYNFSSDSAKAYGNNLIKKGTKFCLYSGDSNKDGTVDLADLAEIDNNAANFLTGYFNTDINNDNLTDIADLSITDNNAFNIITKVTP